MPGSTRIAASRSCSPTRLTRATTGFPLDFRILVSANGERWDEVAKREQFRKPATGAPDGDRKPRDVTGPESFSFGQRPVRFVKVEVTRLRKTRYFGKCAAQLAEIEVVR